jgi:hypothetical protein
LLTEALDLATWKSTGALLIDGFLAADRLKTVRRWVDDIEARPASKNGLLQYDETTPDGRTVRCRTENIVPFHAGLRALLTEGPAPGIAGALLGEPAVLYKEKINYKQSGGAGFAAHQDAPAYPFVRSTITCMIAIDDSTADNGCLEIVEGMHRGPLPTDDAGCIPAGLAATFTWKPVPVHAGSMLWFDWHVPHRSGPNTSPDRRRAIYLTYNPASDGNHRQRYYEEKQHRLADGSGRISLIGHFTGDSHPTPPEPA